MAYWLMLSLMAWPRGFFDFFRRGKIRKALREIDGAVFQGQARHFPDNGFRELLRFRESMRREICAIVGSGELISPSQSLGSSMTGTVSLSACLLRGDLCGHARLAVNHPIDGGVAQDDLHVFACLRERNGFDEFGDFFRSFVSLFHAEMRSSPALYGRGSVLRSPHLAHPDWQL